MNSIPDRSSPGTRTAPSASHQDGGDKLATGGPNAKTTTRIAHWNVRTMYETGKLAQVLTEMRRYRLDLLGVSECRWTGSGRIRANTGETVFYSGREDDQHYQGVAIIMKEGLERCVMEWKPINNRLMSLRLNGRHNKTTIIQCYAPTNDSDEDDKREFYYQLQAEIEKVKRHDLLIIMGDLNAKVGNDNFGFERVMGKHGAGAMNDNGEKLVEFCAMNDLVIGGTLFPHRDIHKLTWNSPNGIDKNQIDHLLINRRWKRSLLDVKVKRGADVGSDHHLVTAQIRVKLRKTHYQIQMSKRFDVCRMNSVGTKTAFTISLKNRFEALQNLSPEDDDNGIDTKWKSIASIFSESSKEILGVSKRRRNKDWIQQETLDTIEERRKAKQKLLQTFSPRLRERAEEAYRELNRKVKRLARQDKRNAMDKLATEAEEAAAKGEQGRLYSITKRVCGKYKGNASGPIKDKHGNLLTSEKTQEARWTEHFKEVLNRPSPFEIACVSEAEEDLNIDVSPPTKGEIIAAIKTLKNGKAPGLDNLNAELFKADPEISATILQPLFTAIWQEEKVPDDWNKGTIVKLPKKGALNDCNNWRGITLLSVPSKILAKIIVRRMSDAVDESLRKEQAGFRKGRRCSDQIFTLRNIIEQCTEWQRELYVNFVDFEKAFDSIHRDSLWRILRHYGIPNKIVQLIKSFYVNFSCNVGSGTSFEVKTGVRQGCVMSAVLFNLVIDWVLRKTTQDAGRGIRWTLFTKLEDLDFADDLALLSHTHISTSRKRQID